jgi:hypothetical protein
MNRLTTRAAWWAAGLLAGGWVAEAQPVVGPLPETQVPPDFERQLQAAQGAPPQSALFATATTELPASSTPFQWGSWDLRPHLSYGFTYGDGIQATPGHPMNTVIQDVAPGIFADLGTHWTVDYTPTWTFYSSHAFHNSLDHAANLAGATEYQGWVFQLTQSYATSHAPLVETGTQTGQQTDSTSLDAKHRLGSELSFEEIATETYESASGLFPSVNDWSSQEQLKYSPTPQFDASLGLVVGYTDVSGGTLMLYLRPQVTFEWRPSKKLTWDAHGGIENRRFLYRTMSALNSPVVGSSVRYQPFENTTLTGGVDRDQAYSFLEEQVNLTTSWSASAEQRLFQHLLAGGQVELQKNTVGASLFATGPAQTNKVESYSVRLGTVSLLRRARVTVSYEGTRNTSNLPGLDFTSHQVRFEVGYRY